MNGISRFFLQVLRGAALAVWLGGVPAFAQDASCLRDPDRARELRVLDEIQLIDMMDEHPVLAAPPRLHHMLRSLVAASPRLRDGPAIHLLAFEDDREHNAYAAHHGLVILTSALWRGATSLNDDELAAVIAHELAHIESHDALVEACGLLQRLGQPRLSIEDAREQMGVHMFNPRSPLVREARELQHAQEHAADLRGIELLRQVGRDPAAMARALAKIHGVQPDSLNVLMGSSHPELRLRLARAQAAVDALAVRAAPD
jgi:Zn-dependent protease with chaperone function